MTIDMRCPLSWKKARDAEEPGSAAILAMLNDLQGNILKGHGRHYTSNLFLRFDVHRATAAKQFLASMAARITSALTQLAAADRYKDGEGGGGDFYSIVVSADGYAALGAAADMPPGGAFRDGMKNRPGLEDSPAAQWDAHFQGEVHAMILVAGETAAARAAARTSLVAEIDATDGAVTLLNRAFKEDGDALFNRDLNGIEHFGYVDGRSQPLALVEQLLEEKEKNGGTSQWDPQIPLEQLLVKCPGGNLDVSMGSYFVFRKLDQNVLAFKNREEELERQFTKDFGVPADQIHERLGATVVGRFENGTPVTMFGTEQSPIPKGPIGVPNDFDYSSDPLGMRCPFAGHIRKTNPRSDTSDSKKHLMARRGIPYGTRSGMKGNVLDDDTVKPSGDVGLLFMAYQSSLEDQFEFTQQTWANNKGFARPTPMTGIDPIIGQSRGPSGQRWPVTYGVSESSGSPDADFSGFVTLRGGEYFFAPSISFFKSLH